MDFTLINQMMLVTDDSLVHASQSRAQPGKRIVVLRLRNPNGLLYRGSSTRHASFTDDYGAPQTLETYLY